METRRSEWEEDKDFTTENLRTMDMKNYNNLLTLGKWYTKDIKGDQTLDIVRLAQNISDESNNASEKSNRELKKG